MKREAVMTSTIIAQIISNNKILLLPTVNDTPARIIAGYMGFISIYSLFPGYNFMESIFEKGE